MENEAQANYASRPKWRSLTRSLPTLVITSLILGLAIGAVIRSMTGNNWTGPLVDFFDVIGTMWVNAIRMTVIPLVLPLLIGSIAGTRSIRTAGRLGVTTIAAFVGLVALLAVTAALAAPLLFSGLHVDPAITSQLRASVVGTVLPTGDATLGGWFKALIPANPIKAAADGTMLSIIVFAVAFGFATLAAPDALRERVVTFAHTVSAIMLILVQGVLMLAPIGVFALTVVVGARMGGTAFAVMGYFIAVESIVSIIVVIALLGLTALWGHLSASRVVRGATPAILVAAGTSSSLSALPAMIEGARDTWNLPESVYGFVLPLAVSTFKTAAAFDWVFNAFFIATLYGIPFGPAQLALAAGYTVLFNVTVPGIPNGGVIAISPMLLALGLPFEGLAILLAVQPIVDRFSTMTNVAADMAVTAVLAARARRSSITGDEIQLAPFK